MRRVVREHQRAIVVLAVLLGANLVAYAAYVYPLAQDVANIQERDRTAEAALAAARAVRAQASGTLTGKDQASTELSTFYKDVLPGDLAGARRLTHLRLPQLARQTGLRYERSQYETVEARDSTLTALRIAMVLSGSYANMRRFIQALESSPEFVVIDNVSLSEADASSGSLTVTLRLSTYYRTAAE
jgi:Tfp pilus assembly protein PilO